MTALAFPPPLRPGDRVAVVAPSSPFPEVLYWRGVGFLAERYRLSFDRGSLARKGYLAGDDARRREELERAFADDDVRAVVAVRGGYGATRIVGAIDWARFARRPKWIVGFSDLTALHVEAWRAGVASIHGAHVTALGRSDAKTRANVVDALERPARERRWSGLESIRNGEATGVLVGGNLALLEACAASSRLRLPRAAILFLEDVTERPYRVDRMLTSLVSGGHLASIGGVVLGDFTDCHPGSDGVSVDQVLRELLEPLGVPVARGLPSGHGIRNDALVLGSEARLIVRSDGASLVTLGSGLGYSE